MSTVQVDEIVGQWDKNTEHKFDWILRLISVRVARDRVAR